MKCDVETDSRKADEVSELKDRAKKIKQKITHFQKETNLKEKTVEVNRGGKY